LNAPCQSSRKWRDLCHALRKSSRKLLAQRSAASLAQSFLRKDVERREIDLEGLADAIARLVDVRGQTASLHGRRPFAKR
jgi:hypothetical protein